MRHYVVRCVNNITRFLGIVDKIIVGYYITLLEIF